MNKNRGIKLSIAAATAVFSLFALPSHAETITVSSGINGAGSVLASGSIDSFWMISTDGANFDNARVAYPGSYPDYSGGQTCCGMDTVDPTAAWITTPSVVSDSPTTGWGVNNTVYARRTLDLSGFDVNSIGLSGEWRVADIAYGIYINGQLVPGTYLPSAYAFSADLGFSVAAGTGFFTAGLNTIELRGQSVNNVWDAFYINGTVTGDRIAAPVPEPETYAMILAGLGLLTGMARRRKGVQ